MPSQMPWSRDEILVVLEAVDRGGWTGMRASSEEALELSALLNAARIHPVDDRPDDFRSSASVQRKAEDVRTAHPGYQGVPTRGGSTTRSLVLEWIADAERLRREALLVRDLMEKGEPLETEPLESAGASEGRLVEAFVRRRERDRNLRDAKLGAVTRAGLTRACEVCAFDFDRTYGPERADGYVEVHHVVPLHISGATNTRLDDLALVCANCHRMLHRHGILTPDELRATITRQTAP